MSRNLRSSAPIIFLLITLTTVESLATERVVLARPRGSSLSEQILPLVEERLHAELSAAGMKVILTEIDLADGESLVDALARSAVELDAIAAVCVVRSGKSGITRIWIDDQVTGKVVMSRFESRAKSPAKEAGEMALRIVELLHASLIELRLMEIEGRQPKKNAPKIKQLVEDKLKVDRPWLSMLVGASALVSLQKLDPLMGLWLGGKARLPHQLSVEVDIGVTPLRANVSGEGGEAEVGLAMVRTHLSLEAPWDWFFVPSIGMGAGFLLLWADGHADDGYDGTMSLANATALSLRISATTEFTDRLRCRLVAGSMTTFPRLAVRFSDEIVARTGRPLLEFGIVFELR